MTKYSRRWSRMQAHPSEEQLFLAFDADLSHGEAERIRKHIEECWECKAKWDEWNEARTGYMQYKHEVQHHPLPPPANWSSFQLRLNHLSRELHAHRENTLRARLAKRTRILLAAPALRTAVASIGILAFVVGSIVMLSRKDIPTVSASEVLQQSAANEQRALLGAKQPVVYQKLSITVGNRRFVRTIYRDMTTPRQADHIVGAASSAPANEVAQDVAPAKAAFSDASLDWADPLSPWRFNDWRTSTRVRSVRVLRGRNLTEIRTRAGGAVVEANMTFRNGDYHPVAAALTLNDNTRVEIAELDYKVMDLGQLSASLFGPAHPPLLASPQPRLGAIVLPSIGDLQLAALTSLDAIDALLKDQIKVSATGDGKLLVQGVVATAERKAQIERSLASIASNPSVSVDIQTVAEAEAEQQQSVSGPLKLDSVNVTQQLTPSQQYILRYLSASGVAGANLQSQLQTFTYGVFDHSSRALMNAVLLRQIAESYTRAEQGRMTPDAQQKWQELMSRHAEVVARELAALRTQLQPIFGVPTAPAGAQPPSLDVRAASSQMAELVTALDKDIGNSLAISQSGANDNSIHSQAFWNSLQQAEALASVVLKGAAN